MHIDDKQFKDLVIEIGLLSRSDVDMLELDARRKGMSLSMYLVTTGKMTAADTRRLEGQLLNIPFIDLTTKKISFDILSIIPEPIVRAQNIIAFDLKDDTVSVALLSVAALASIDFLKEKTKLRIRPYFTNYESVKTHTLNYQKELKKRFGDSIKRSVDSIKKNVQTDFRNTTQVLRELERQAQDEATIHLVETLIGHAQVHHASDIHIEPTADHVVVRYRIGGVLHEAMLLAKDVLESIVSRMKFLAQLKLEEQKNAQHGSFTINGPHESIHGAVSFVPTHHGQRLTIRLKYGALALSLESLGFHGVGLEQIHAVLRKRSGAVLVAGPRGSGVNTILYALLDAIAAPHMHTTTIEGSIDKTLQKATQLLLRPDLGFDARTAISTALKHDTDVLMLSELSTTEVARSALQSATLGRLVIAGVRTHSAIDALLDLIDVGVAPELIASTVDMVIGTRLVPQLPAEKTKYFLEKGDIKSLGKLVNLPAVLEQLKKEAIVPADATWETIPFYKAKTQKTKDLTSKVVGIQEILIISRPIRDLLVSDATVADIEKQMVKAGMPTLLEDGLIKAVQGQVALEEVLKILSR